MEQVYDNQDGKLTCNKTILYSIVRLATKEISGVVGFSKKMDKLTSSLFHKKDFNGIIIKYNATGQLIIEVFIDVYSDTSAPDLCFKVQESIKNSILNMVDVRAERVNVHIMDVIVKEEGGEEKNEGTI